MEKEAERASSRAPHMLVVMSLLALCACADGANRHIAEPAPPPGSTLPYPSDGPLMTSALFTLADLRSRLQAHYDTAWDGRRYAIPAEIGWPSIIEHYARELGSGWRVDARYAENAGKGYRSKVWSDGEHAVA